MQYRFVYFVGIGGIGMSALARWFNVNGFDVAGYDRTPSPLTHALENEGIAIHFDDDISAIPARFLAQPTQTLVVYTPAIPKDHSEFNYLKNNGFEIQKRSQVLGLLAKNMLTVAVAGTHGKTSTSALIAHIIKDSGVNCAAFLGGITQNYQSNFLLNQPADDLSKVPCVVEADEFDRSFLTLFADIAVVTSTDADHLDIYGNHHEMLNTFGDFVGQIKPTGIFFMHADLDLAGRSLARVVRYGINAQSGVMATNVRIENAHFVFDLTYESTKMESIVMQVPGFHNVENAAAAVGVALELGINEAQIRKALATFKGIKRRFEYHLRKDSVVQIDDYAHHPTEITAFLTSVRALYPGRKITAVFQPHLFSRTRDFAAGFAESLSLADSLILLDIYPAREQPIDGVNSQLILGQVTIADKQLSTKTDLLEILKRQPTDVVVTIGAGDIDRLIEPIKQVLLQKTTAQ